MLTCYGRCNFFFCFKFLYFLSYTAFPACPVIYGLVLESPLVMIFDGVFLFLFLICSCFFADFCLTTVAQRPDDVFDNKYEIYRRRADVILTIQRREGLGANYNKRNIEWLSPWRMLYQMVLIGFSSLPYRKTDLITKLDEILSATSESKIIIYFQIVIEISKIKHIC